MAAKLSSEPKPKPGAMSQPAGNGGDGRALAPEDNLKAVEEAERAQLISFVSRLVQQKRESKKAKDAYDTEKAKETEIFRLAKLASPRFLRERLERYIGKLTGGASSRDIAEEARVERQHEEWLNIPTGATQLDLFSDTTPIEVRDEAYWKAEGYLAYQRGDVCKPPQPCPARFVTVWTAGWNDGQSATIWAMGKVSEAPAPVGHLADPAEQIGDDFEAPAAELEGQTTRKVVTAKRATASETA